RSLISSSAFLSRISREIVGTSSISAPASWIVAGITSKLAVFVETHTSSAGRSSTSILYTQRSISALSTPTPLVALPCGSISTSKTLLSNLAMPALNLTADVVFPTPPFWLAMAIVLPMLTLALFLYCVVLLLPLERRNFIKQYSINACLQHYFPHY